MTILSIDPGIERFGIAIFKNNKYTYSILLKTSKNALIPKRLEEIYTNLNKIIKKYQPNIIVLESLFFFKNQKTAITIGHVQGIIYLLASQHNIKIETLSPLEIKLALTGYGKADKKAIQKLLKMELNLNITQDDEADAIGCGYAYILKNQKR